MTPRERSTGGTDFILMMTLNDVTVADALERHDELRDARLRSVGFKDVGIPPSELRELTARAHEAGRRVFLEIVSESRDAEMRSAEMGVELGVDYLIGGTRTEEVLELVAGTEISFYPYVGTVVGHPCMLKGDPQAIADDAQGAVDAGAEGVNLLAYRYLDGDALSLIRRVVEAVQGRVIVAGDVVRPKQVVELAGAGVFGFTIGGAVIERRFSDGDTFATQVSDVLDVLDSRT